MLTSLIDLDFLSFLKGALDDCNGNPNWVLYDELRLLSGVGIFVFTLILKSSLSLFFKSFGFNAAGTQGLRAEFNSSKFLRIHFIMQQFLISWKEDIRFSNESKWRLVVE